ncbi:inositol 2-dehydrogenase [Anaerosacchariphilus polymeriproducens]|uniref:Inositol 2-dehydrogenase n=1 Tax=Anaerosacchariphilus polymeriproducens TaxID=1812858 RepID=A0A371ARX6_9FIRM|nr:inositol 2-dehydrogenase [Anaerosacchariphilus polymeriproducens]RDU22292.1 inositol 2-dehydrogenase [Anaerosacchariphilus polymeriproducens]
MAEVKIGILGAGRIGKLHATNLVNAVPGAKVVAIADLFMNDEIIDWAKGLGIEKCTDNPDDIFKDSNIDAVFICSSTNTHADFIIKAAEAGQHIFCEKPIHTDLNKIEEAIAAVEKAKVKLQVGFVRRFDHNHKKVRDTVASGRLGAPHIVKVCSRDPEAPPMSYVKVSGGIFMDMMIHDFDMVRYLSGSEVTEVSTFGTCVIDPEFKKYDDVDTAIVMLKFENGAIGVIDNSRRAGYGYDQRTEVHCEKGCVQVSNDLNDTSMISTAEGVICEKPTWFFLERYNNAFIAESVDFVNAVQNDTDVPVGGIDGLMPVKIAMAAKKSLDEGRPVKISEIK